MNDSVAQHRSGFALNDADLAARFTTIWAELLAPVAITPDDDVFDNGGDSLLALRFTFRAKTDLGIIVPLSIVFENRTMRECAIAINASSRNAPEERAN